MTASYCSKLLQQSPQVTIWLSNSMDHTLQTRHGFWQASVTVPGHISFSEWTGVGSMGPICLTRMAHCENSFATAPHAPGSGLIGRTVNGRHITEKTTSKSWVRAGSNVNNKHPKKKNPQRAQGRGLYKMRGPRERERKEKKQMSSGRGWRHMQNLLQPLELTALCVAFSLEIQMKQCLRNT